MRNKVYNFVYKTTNLINNKYYIGVRSTNNLDDGYIGCGITSQSYAEASKKYGLKSALIDAVIKYGYHNFKREIITFTSSKEEALELEELIVDREFINNSNNYNISIGGSSGSKYSTSIEFDNLIFKEYMEGKTKKEISKEYNISLTLIFRIIKDRDTSNRKIKNNKNLIIRNNIIKWLKINGEELLRKYINWELTWVELNNLLPFDLQFFDLLKNIERNRKYVCIHPEGNIFFNTEKEISEILKIKIFRAGYISVIENKINTYKNYKFRRACEDDFKKLNYTKIIHDFEFQLQDSFNNLKFNHNRGIIKK